MATVGAMAITGVAYIANARWGFNPLGLEHQDFVGLLTAEAISAVALILPGVLGRGYETIEVYEKIVAEKKQIKVAKKQAIVQGAVIAPEKEAEKLAKKLGIAIEAALPIVQEQVKAKQQAIALKANAVEQIAVTKLAKKLHISEAQAQVIRAEQLKNTKK